MRKPLIFMMFGVFLLASCVKDFKNESKNLEIATVENRTVPCPDNNCNGPLPKIIEAILWIEGCRVKVTYEIQECPNITEFSKIKIQIIGGCLESLKPSFLSVSSNLPEVNGALNVFHKKVLDKIEELYMNNKLAAINSVHNVQWIEKSCFKYCITNIYDLDDETWDVITPIKCGESCCRRVTQYLRLPGNIWSKGPTVVTGDNICTPTAIVIGPECTTQPGTLLDFCNVACNRL